MTHNHGYAEVYRRHIDGARREREERAAGRGPDAALRSAAATSGRSVLISGLTVMVAMAGMFVSGMQLFAGFAIATARVVLIAMVGAVTVLPALLSLLGDRAEWGRVPFLSRVRRPSDGSRLWRMVLDRVLARPGLSAALSAGFLHAIAALHDTIVPATVGKIPGGQALVGGTLAASIDFNNQLRHGIVPVFLFVLGITFILMLTAFRSIVIAATTIVLNLLSVAAAYGAMVAVYQHGWGAALIGTRAPGAIESWIPLFVFVVLFGLSMDYNLPHPNPPQPAAPSHAQMLASASSSSPGGSRVLATPSPLAARSTAVNSC
jgi:uncharacterized membrane protein YdfJ with MMPL/SSD domain